MTLTELKYIVAVAREKHFGKAAEACFVSQPTLSVAIKKLEDELEVKLFERSANEVTVTPLGEDIVRQAQSVLEQAASIKEIAKRGKDPMAGPLKPLPQMLPAEILAPWRYEEERSHELYARDRSAIYGGFHLYVLGG